jgi:ribosomal protein L16 Arg81 hydroxylase
MTEWFYIATHHVQVDLEDVDHARFPRFASAPFQDCVLESGQMLYIPPGWWHFVKSLSPSFSVSYWWQ